VADKAGIAAESNATHLRALEKRSGRDEDAATTFPFSVPTIRTLERLDLSAQVTFFVGSNGSGKSTLLETIASLANLQAIGSEDVSRDETLAK
jgi:predicted ATPase